MVDKIFHSCSNSIFQELKARSCIMSFKSGNKTNALLASWEICPQEMMIHRGEELIVGPEHTYGLFSLTSTSLLVQNIPYLPRPPPAAEQHWAETDKPHGHHARESRSWTTNSGVAAANELRTRTKKRVGPGDTVFASCASGFMTHLWSPGLRHLSGKKMNKTRKVTNLQYALWWFLNMSMWILCSLSL